MTKKLLLVAMLMVCVAGGGASSASASPGSLKVLVAYSDSGGAPTALVNALNANPDVASVTTFNAGTGTPTLAQMSAYDVVTASDYSPYSSPATLGDNLADYIDAGGIAVIDEEAWLSTAAYQITGRYQSGGYSPYNFDGVFANTNSTLGVYDSNSPLMQGVTSLAGTYRYAINLAAGATQVAAWADGKSAVAYKGRSVGVNEIPTASAAYWQTTATSYARIIVNAGNFLGSQPTLAVAKGGTGSGVVTSTPAGINCGSTCVAPFLFRSSVTLNAAPSPGSTFAGWSGGGCSGTGACTVTMNGTQGVTAGFVLSAGGGNGAGGGSSAPSAPTLAGFAIHPRTFIPLGSGASIAKKQRGTGATVSYSDSQAAITTLTVTRTLLGVRAHGACYKAPRHPKRHAKRCRITQTLGRFTHTDSTGQARFRFSGRVGGHKLAKGSYVLTAVARNSVGLSSKPVSTGFAIR